jgi:hypothetical protein
LKTCTVFLILKYDSPSFHLFPSHNIFITGDQYDELQDGFLSQLLYQVGNVMEQMQERDKERDQGRLSGGGHSSLSAPQIKGTFPRT